MTGTPRILHITTGKDFRGGERQLLFLHEGLLGREIESFLLVRKKSALAAMSIRNKAAFGFPAIKKIDPDIIHCHDSPSLTLGYIASVMFKKRLVFTRKTVFPIRDTWFNRLKYNRCFKIVAISNAVAALCRPVIRDQNKIEIIPDGVIVDGNDLSREQSRSDLNIPPDIFAIGIVAYFTREKNIGLIADLAKSLQSSHPDARIVCVGSLTPEALSKVRGLTNVILTGVVGNIEKYYRAFDLYISTSTREGLGSALIDAMVRDIPVVAKDSGGSRDLFPENSPLLIAAGDDAGFIAVVKNIMNDTGAYAGHIAELGEFCRSRFRVRQMVDSHVALYRAAT
jgi:glycosyltransferase involved in cell wall biosynthesis